MGRGAITGYIDVAQLVLYAFWIFFAGLILYLRREDKREGYPLWSEATSTAPITNFPPIPPAKTFRLHEGGTAIADGRPDLRPIKASPVEPWPGAPLTPTGNPMLDGVGPAAYAERADVPEQTFEGEIKIVPLRAAHGFYLESRDPDPRGMTVKGADKRAAGTVKDVWVDRSEFMIRYLEVALAGSERHVLVPMNFTRVDGEARVISVVAILAKQFADVPATKSMEQVTRLEEEKICAYFAGGYLYATPERAEPLI
jgi:photosynthetic reaction center H subunit